MLKKRGYWAGKKRPPMTKKTKEKISKGEKLFYTNHPEAKLKIAKRMFGNKFTLGKTPWNKGIPYLGYGKKHPFFGKHHSEALRKKMSKRMKRNPLKYWLGKKRYDMIGNKHWNWKGGTSSLRKEIRGSFEYRLWRSDCFRRDDFTCQECKIKGNRLVVDHIKPFVIIIAEYKITSLEKALNCEELWDINNGRTLCEDCHKKTNTYGLGALKYQHAYITSN